MSLNKNLHEAKRQKNDDFYTQLPDIENELRHYAGHFRRKVVYCNCDDPRVSNFFHYFSYNFEHLGLKKLIAACPTSDGRDAAVWPQAAWVVKYIIPQDSSLRPSASVQTEPLDRGSGHATTPSKVRCSSNRQ